MPIDKNSLNDFSCLFFGFLLIVFGEQKFFKFWWKEFILLSLTCFFYAHSEKSLFFPRLTENNFSTSLINFLLCDPFQDFNVCCKSKGLFSFILYPVSLVLLFTFLPLDILCALVENQWSLYFCLVLCQHIQVSFLDWFAYLCLNIMQSHSFDYRSTLGSKVR